LAALGLSLPSRHITVNLAPADVLKEGSHFDLPIALALLAAMDVLPEDELAGYTALGEVALDGSLTSVAGVLLAALTAAARQSGLEIAAAGSHNLLMIGPPGAGKSMLAARLPGILPPLEPAEALELGMIQSVAGGLRNGGLLRERPFRDPHHSASLPALVGGG